MTVGEPWFSFIESGEKRIEGRKRSEKWSHIKVGDRIEIACNENQKRNFIVRVKDIRYYDTLYEYLSTEPLCYVLPGVESVEDATKIYLRYFTIEEIKDCGGMMAIEVERVF
jgi:ASC-1-like (ASCH) protein